MNDRNKENWHLMNIDNRDVFVALLIDYDELKYFVQLHCGIIDFFGNPATWHIIDYCGEKYRVLDTDC